MRVESFFGPFLFPSLFLFRFDRRGTVVDAGGGSGEVRFRFQIMRQPLNNLQPSNKRLTGTFVPAVRMEIVVWHLLVPWLCIESFALERVYGILFESSVMSLNKDSAKRFLKECHRALQEVVDKSFNHGMTTVVPDYTSPCTMSVRFPVKAPEQSLLSTAWWVQYRHPPWVGHNITTLRHFCLRATKAAHCSSASKPHTLCEGSTFDSTWGENSKDQLHFAVKLMVIHKDSPYRKIFPDPNYFVECNKILDCFLDDKWGYNSSIADRTFASHRTNIVVYTIVSLAWVEKIVLAHAEYLERNV